MNYNFTKDYDVVVSGGGIGGCAAALEAARCGKKTLLAEKQCVLGGLATSGLVYIYLPICDGRGKQVMFGIAEEFLHNSITMGPGNIHENWQNPDPGVPRQRYRCTFSPASFMLTIEELLVDAGVDIWYDTRVCETHMDHGKVSGVTVVNESGFGKINAKCVIDATGSCIVAHCAGLPCIEEDNFMTVWAMEYREGAEQDWGKNQQCWNITMNSFDGESRLLLTPEMREKCYPGLNDEELRKRIVCHGSTGRIVSDFVLESHRILREHYKDADRNTLFPVKLSGMPQFRKIRCIEGEYVLKKGDDQLSFDDSTGLIGDWRRPGCVWEVPYRTLFPANGVAGLLCAGRCSAACGDAWEATRVIPSAALTGQICGLAASLSIDTGKDIPELDVVQLQNQLRKKGFIIHK